MAFALFLGCYLLAFGPATVYLYVIFRRAHLTTLAVVAAFVELIAFVLTSVVWTIASSFYAKEVLTLVFGVFFQESARMLFVVGYGVTERKLYAAAKRSLLTASMYDVAATSSRDGPGLRETNNNNNNRPDLDSQQSEDYRLPFTDFSSALASGFGFSLMYGLLIYGNMLITSARSQGDFYSPHCPGVSLFVVEALGALAMQIVHVFLTVLAFDAIRHKTSSSSSSSSRGWRMIWRTLLVFGLHLAASLSTLANANLGCQVGMPLLWVVTALTAAEALRCVNAKDWNVTGSALVAARIN